jgi:hypothetical protein
LVKNASRVVAWVGFGFGLLCLSLGAAFCWAGGGKDVGGVVGWVFIVAGFFLAGESLSHIRANKN